ncbi:MAG TPA: HpcH/HpaI aldolase/citrate lyase family protein [Allosphingosinicella sp.]|jgi:citrate lyase beta subunit|nr:HpcH/HpaI aldolase/citrate lyase family protein [Allosphingosinicella sp.]
MDAIALGATLYVPASRTDLAAILGGRHPDLRSAVLCLEDSIHHQEIPLALTNLAALLRAERAPGGPALFVRPRDSAMLTHILSFEGVENLAGFVIPKATPDNFPAWLHCLADDRHLLMPTLETPQLLDESELRSLRDQFLAVQPRILAIRIGGNDLLKAIGARRSAVRTAYDGPLGTMIAGFVAAFAPFGFALSAPVFEHFANAELLREEVERDLEHGLFTKTAIHPSQIRVIQAAYAVDADALAEAEAMVMGEPRGVFASRGAMCEPETHGNWAHATIRRAQAFGVTGGARVSGLRS